MPIDTRHQWLKEFANRSQFVKSQSLNSSMDEVIYVERPTGKKPDFKDVDAYNVANSPPHNDVIVETIEGLRGQMTDTAICSLLGELTKRKTYGALSEIFAYHWIIGSGATFRAQVAMGKGDVINANGTASDAEITLKNGKKAYLDIKGFGFVGHKLDILKKRLEKEFVCQDIFIEGDWNLAMDDMQALLDFEGFSSLVSELKAKSLAKRNLLEFYVQKKQHVTVASHAYSPKELAEKNKDYPFRFMSQFTLNYPFLLVFVHQWWFHKGMLHNFGGNLATFCQEISELAFDSFSENTTLVEGKSRAEASKLLSGMVFLNGWPSAGTDAPREKPFCRIFLNNSAIHKLVPEDFDDIVAAYKDDISIVGM